VPYQLTFQGFKRRRNGFEECADYVGAYGSGAPDALNVVADPRVPKTAPTIRRGIFR
jgi:hypothetical protein